MMQDQLSRTFAALSDPTRRAILARLSEGEANVGELARPFLKTMSLPAVTKHLKVLESARLVTKTRSAQRRPCKLNSEPLRKAVDWMEQHRIAWEESLDRLDAYLKTKTRKTPARHHHPMKAGIQSNVISIVRVYDAPLQAVWDAWTIPEEVAQWWGPRGFTLTHHSRDLRTGGHWHYTMHGPDGVDYENTTQYLEVVPKQRLVYDHGGHKDRPPLFRVTALFSEQAGRTTLSMEMAFATPEVAREMKGFIRKAGGEGTWDRLAEYLGHRCNGKDLFFMARSFDTNIEHMYELWSDPAEMAKWLPPTGATMKFLRVEPWVGGTSHYSMAFGDNPPMYGLVTYVERAKPNRLTYTQQFCDEHEKVIRPPFFPHWPVKMLTTVELVSEGENRTRVTVRWEPVEFTEADLAEFIKQRGSMSMGWTGSFDKLEAVIG